MNKAKLKSYAPQARKDFIAAVTARANLLGLSESGGKLEVAVGERKGDMAIIAGREWPAKVYAQREDLIKRMQTEGFSQTVDAVAYTWFNRFAALRYMEIHDYLDHGQRVLSNREGGMPEILNQATNLDLPHFNKAQAIELKLAGNKDNELYKLILVAQCNALSNAMPFLFERIDDETELLLPDNLLLTDSVIAKLVSQIPEEDWQEVEIIGWLYQFYISEKKDQVIGKVVKSEDIPAATQLFTPNWIVQYLVQNSVGRLWMMANPNSTLKSQWPYYIEPAEQTPEVNTQLDALIQTRMDEDGGSLNPETITVLDPACGSGHILVVAYDVLKAIYLERGYQPRSIPRLILEKNLFGLDIDDRAAQMAGFALLMKARADDRRVLQEPLKLNVISLQESKGLNADHLAQSLSEFGVNRNSIADLIEHFQHAKTFGSLIQIPAKLTSKINALNVQCQQAQYTGDLFAQEAAKWLLPLITQANLLAKQYDAVIANPPYMGGKYLNQLLKEYLKNQYIGFEKDLFSAFVIRCSEFGLKLGQIGVMSPNVWMYISSHETLRNNLLKIKTLTNLVELPLSGFKGATVQICAYNFINLHLNNFIGGYVRLVEFKGGDNEMATQTLEAIQNPKCGWFYSAKPDDFKKIPGSPIAYWVGKKIHDTFSKGEFIQSYAVPRQGFATGDNDRFLRFWHEVDLRKTSITTYTKNELLKWYPCNKGGAFRKWYGNNYYLVNWENDGQEMRDFEGSVIRNPSYYFKSGATWSTISSSSLSMRYSPEGFLFETKGSVCFPKSKYGLNLVLGLMNSAVVRELLLALSPTLDFHEGPIGKVPVLPHLEQNAFELVNKLINTSKKDWDSYETSWDFTHNPVIRTKQSTIAESFKTWQIQNSSALDEMKRLEEENNSLFIEEYGLQDELTPDVPDDQITLTRADREKDSQRLLSFAIGCMMGRFSLDEPGLIYAHAGNIEFDANRYNSFPADADGIVPITDALWFEDDAANRIREFLIVVWGAETLDENMAWLAESLGSKGSEAPDETIRRYLTSSFFKNHLQTYKKRPIYWLFSSGKQGAFQALVYLHRYNEGTLARMRSEYVVPLTGKMLLRIEMLEKDAASVSSSAARAKINKEIEVLRKQHIELLAYDEKLRHYADMRIQLDLDDGVKVNYGKFGDLLAEVKAVTGGAGDD
jgi:type II restriction/modification system DNA methylase subunit YeeA